MKKSQLGVDLSRAFVLTLLSVFQVVSIESKELRLFTSENSAPLGAPMAPGERFTARLLKSTSLGSPVIAAWNKSAHPDECITLTGIRFTVLKGEDEGTDTLVWASDGKDMRQAQILRLNPDRLTIIIPPMFSYSLYLLWVQNNSGTSAPVAINKTDARWIGPLGDVAHPGEIKRVFGKDLSLLDTAVDSHVYLRPSGTNSFLGVPVIRAHRYAVEFRIPETLASGEYDVFVHNGHGGTYGWGEPIALRVTQLWRRGNDILNVAPSGGDDAPAIQAALRRQAASAHGGIVRLAAANYQIDSPIFLLSKIQLEGLGKDVTTLEIRLRKPARAGVMVQGNRVGLVGMTLKLIKEESTAKPLYDILGADGSSTQWRDVLFSDLRITANDPEAGVWSAGVSAGFVHFEMRNCELERTLSLSFSDQWIHENHFYGSPFVSNEAAVGMWNVHRLVLENNVIETKHWGDWDNPASKERLIARRFFHAALHTENITDVFVAENTGKDIAPAPGENKGEMMLLHGDLASWYGQVLSSNGTTVTVRTDGLISGHPVVSTNYGATTYSGPLSDPLTQAAPYPRLVAGKMYMAIVGGAGLGQLKQVTSLTSDTVTVDSPWRVSPDSSSAVTLGYIYRDIVMYKNNLGAFPDGVNGLPSASNLAQLDGNCWENVVDANVSRHTAQGVTLGASPLTQSFWNEIIGNRLLEVQSSGLTLVLWDNSGTVALIGPATLGNVFRHNYVDITGPQSTYRWPDWVYQMGILGGSWQGATVSAPFPYHDGDIMEGNATSGGRRGILAGDWDDTVFRRNSIRVDQSKLNLPIAQPVQFRPKSFALLIQNTYEGSDTTYFKDRGANFATTPLLPLLPSVEVSCTRVSSCSPIVVPLLAAGKDAIHWSASSNAQWITVSPNRGTSDAEKITPLVIRVTPSAAAARASLGQVTLQYGAGLVKFGVRLEPRGVNSGTHEKY